MQGLFSSTAGASACSHCGPSGFCPLGADSPLYVAPQSALVVVDPTTSYQTDQQNTTSDFRLNLGIAAGCIFAIILFLSFLLGCCGRPDVIRRVDILHPLRPVPMEKTVYGGVLSLFLFVGFVLSFIYSIYDYSFVQVRTATLSASSVTYVPGADSVPVEIDVTFIGCPQTACSSGQVQPFGLSAGYTPVDCHAI